MRNKRKNRKANIKSSKSASIIATLDVLASLATVADDMNYVMPIVDNSGMIDIKDGRHPVIEKYYQVEALLKMIHI